MEWGMRFKTESAPRSHSNVGRCGRVRSSIWKFLVARKWPFPHTNSIQISFTTRKKFSCCRFWVPTLTSGHARSSEILSRRKRKKSTRNSLTWKNLIRTVYNPTTCTETPHIRSINSSIDCIFLMCTCKEKLMLPVIWPNDKRWGKRISNERVVVSSVNPYRAAT